MSSGIEVASAQRFLHYDFVVRVPLPLDVATARMEACLSTLRSFFAPVRVRVDGRVFYISYWRWPFADSEGQVVPNDVGTTDIMVSVGQWDALFAVLYLVIAIGCLLTRVEDFWLPFLAIGVVVIAVVLYRTWRIRRSIVGFFSRHNE